MVIFTCGLRKLFYAMLLNTIVISSSQAQVDFVSAFNDLIDIPKELNCNLVGRNDCEFVKLWVANVLADIKVGGEYKKRINNTIEALAESGSPAFRKGILGAIIHSRLGDQKTTQLKLQYGLEGSLVVPATRWLIFEKSCFYATEPSWLGYQMGTGKPICVSEDDKHLIKNIGHLSEQERKSIDAIKDRNGYRVCILYRNTYDWRHLSRNALLILPKNARRLGLKEIYPIEIVDSPKFYKGVAKKTFDFLQKEWRLSSDKD